MILTSRFASVIHTISSKIHVIAVRWSEGYSRIMTSRTTEFQFRCLRIRFVSHGVVCFHSVGLGCHFPKRHMIGVSCFTFIIFRIPYSFSVTFFTLGFRLFCKVANKRRWQKNSCSRESGLVFGVWRHRDWCMMEWRVWGGIKTRWQLKRTRSISIWCCEDLILEGNKVKFNV